MVSQVSENFLSLSKKNHYEISDLRFRDSTRKNAPPLYSGACVLCGLNNILCICNVNGSKDFLWVNKHSLVNWNGSTSQKRKKSILEQSHVLIFRDKYLIFVLRLGPNRYVIALNPHDSSDSSALRAKASLPAFTYYLIEAMLFDLEAIFNRIATNPREFGRSDVQFNCDLDDCNREDVFCFFTNITPKLKPIRKFIRRAEDVIALHELVNKQVHIDDGVFRDAPESVFEFFTEPKRVNPQFYDEYEKRFSNLTLDESIKTLFFAHIPTHRGAGLFYKTNKRHHGIRFEVNSLDRYDGLALEDLFSSCVASHYKKNAHHPEHSDTTMSIIATIELLIDLWVSAMRQVVMPLEAFKIFRGWLLDIETNKADVYTKINIRPKFKNINPVGILLFMHHIVTVGVTSSPRDSIMNAARKRSLPLSKLGKDFVDDPSKILSVSVSKKRAFYKEWTEMHYNFDDTLQHVWGVDTLMNDFLLSSGHDSDKFNFDMMAIYALRWNCCLPDGEPKQFIEMPDFKSDIPDFPKSSSLPDSFLSNIGDKWKKSIADYVKNDVLDGIVNQAKITLQHMIKIFGNISVLMDRFKEFFKPVLEYFNISLSAQDIDAPLIITLLGCWLAFVNTVNPVLQAGVIIIVASKLGIFEKMMTGVKTVCELVGLDFDLETDSSKKPKYCSTGTSGLVDFFSKIFDPENSQYAGWLVAFLVTLICGYKSFDKDFVRNQGGAVMSVFKNLHFVGAGIFGLSRVTNWVTAGVKIAFEFIREKIFHKEPLGAEEKRKAREFQDQVAMWSGVVASLSVSNSSMVISKSKMLRKKVKDLYAEGLSFQVKIIAEEKADSRERLFPSVLLHEVRDKLKMLKPLYDSVTRLESHGKTRPVPFHVQFVGAAGAGKSFLHQRLVSEIHRRFYPTFDRSFIDYCDPGPSVAYKNGYCGQKVYRFDEAWPNDNAERVTEFLLMMSNAALNMPMAHLDQKETYFESEWILSNTNTPYPNVTGMYHIDALLRRRDMLVEVVIDEDVKQNDGTLDRKKFAEKYPKQDFKDFPHLKFSFRNTMRAGEAEQTAYEKELVDSGIKAPMVNLSFPEFVNRLFARREFVRSEQDKMFKDKADPYRFIKDLLAEIKTACSDSFHPTGSMFEKNFGDYFDVFEPPEDFTYDTVFDTFEDFDEILKELSKDPYSLAEHVTRYLRLVNDPENVVLHDTMTMDLTGILENATVNLKEDCSPEWFYYYWLVSMLVKFGAARRDILDFHFNLHSHECSMADFQKFLNIFSNKGWEAVTQVYASSMAPALDPLKFCKSLVEKIEKKEKIVKREAHIGQACYYVVLYLDNRENTDQFTTIEKELLDTSLPNYCAKWCDEDFANTYPTMHDHLDAIGNCAQLTTKDKDVRNKKLVDLIDSFVTAYCKDPDDAGLEYSKSVSVGLRLIHQVEFYENDSSAADYVYALIQILARIVDILGEEAFRKNVMISREGSPITYINFRSYSALFDDPYNTRWWTTSEEYKTRAAKKTDKQESEYRSRFMFDFDFGNPVFGTRYMTMAGKEITVIEPHCVVLRKNSPNHPLGGLSKQHLTLSHDAAIRLGHFDLIGTQLSFGLLCGLVFNEKTKEWGYDPYFIQQKIDETGLTMARVIAEFDTANCIEAFARLPFIVQCWFHENAYYYRKAVLFAFLLTTKILEFRARVYATVIASVRCTYTWLFKHFSDFKRVYISIIISCGITWGFSKIGSFFSPSYKSSQPVKSVPVHGMPAYKNALDVSFLESHKRLFIFSSVNGQNFHSIRLYGQILMCPMHAFRSVLNSPDKTFRFSFRPTHKQSSFWTIVGNKCDVRKIPSCDAVLVYLRDIAPSKDNLEKFWTLEQLEKFQIPEQLGIAYYDTNRVDEVAIHTQTLPTITTKVEKLPGLDDGVMYYNIHCRGYFVNGSSGTPVIGLNPFLGDKTRILGVVSCQWDNSAIVSVVPRDVIMDVLEDLDYTTANVVFEGPAFCSSGVPVSACDVEEHIEVVGVVDEPMRVSAPLKTAYSPSPIAHLYPPSKRRPALLRPTTQIPSPSKHSLNKHGRDVMRPLDPELLSEATNGVSRYVRNLVLKHRGRTRFPLRVFDLEEAVFGFGSPYFKPLDWTTSPGLPFVKEADKPGKRTFFNPEKKWIHPAILGGYEHIRRGLQFGKIRRHLMYDFKKDELRPIDKVLEGKTRTVTVNNVIWGILYRQLFGDLETVLREASDGSSQYIPGCDIFSMHGFNMFATMFTDRPNCFFLDIGNWDGHMTPQLFNAVTDMVNEVYRGNSMNEFIEPELTREGIAAQAMFAFVQYGDMVYRKWRGVPSGFAGTTTYNTLGHMILFYYFYLEIMKDHRRISDMNFNTYEFNVQARFCGDDLNCGVSDSIVDIFNGITVSAKYAKYGWPATNGSDKTKPVDKSVHPREGVILKTRPYAWESYDDIILYVLDEEVCNDMLIWTKRTENGKKQFYMNCLVALEFMCRRGPHTYILFADKLDRALIEMSMTPINVTYEEMSRMVRARLFKSIIAHPIKGVPMLRGSNEPAENEDPEETLLEITRTIKHGMGISAKQLDLTVTHEVVEPVVLAARPCSSVIPPTPDCINRAREQLNLIVQPEWIDLFIRN